MQTSYRGSGWAVPVSPEDIVLIHRIMWEGRKTLAFTEKKWGGGEGHCVASIIKIIDSGQGQNLP